MSEMRIKFISAGFKSILSSEGVANEVRNIASRIAANANANNERGGEGFVASDIWHAGYGGGRVACSVFTTDVRSRIAEAEDKALSRAVF